jgi:hypothetical protein
MSTNSSSPIASQDLRSWNVVQRRRRGRFPVDGRTGVEDSKETSSRVGAISRADRTTRLSCGTHSSECDDPRRALRRCPVCHRYFAQPARLRDRVCPWAGCPKQQWLREDAPGASQRIPPEQLSWWLRKLDDTVAAPRADTGAPCADSSNSSQAALERSASRPPSSPTCSGTSRRQNVKMCSSSSQTETHELPRDSETKRRSSLRLPQGAQQERGEETSDVTIGMLNPQYVTVPPCALEPVAPSRGPLGFDEIFALREESRVRRVARREQQIKDARRARCGLRKLAALGQLPPEESFGLSGLFEEPCAPSSSVAFLVMGNPGPSGVPSVVAQHARRTYVEVLAPPAPAQPVLPIHIGNPGPSGVPSVVVVPSQPHYVATPPASSASRGSRAERAAAGRVTFVPSQPEGARRVSISAPSAPLVESAVEAVPREGVPEAPASPPAVRSIPVTNSVSTDQTKAEGPWKNPKADKPVKVVAGKLGRPVIRMNLRGAVKQFLSGEMRVDDELYWELQLKAAFQARTQAMFDTLRIAALRYLDQFDCTELTAKDRYELVVNAVTAAMDNTPEEIRARQLLKEPAATRERQMQAAMVTTGALGTTGLGGFLGIGAKPKLPSVRMSD